MFVQSTKDKTPLETGFFGRIEAKTRKGILFGQVLMRPESILKIQKSLLFGLLQKISPFCTMLWKKTAFPLSSLPRGRMRKTLNYPQKENERWMNLLHLFS